MNSEGNWIQPSCTTQGQGIPLSFRFRFRFRFSTALRRFLQNSLSVESLRAIVLARLALRQDTFLRIVERCIY